MFITYQCPECLARRGAQERVSTPDLTSPAMLKPNPVMEDTGGWYLCWCRGDSSPVRMLASNEMFPRDSESGKPLMTSKDDQQKGFQTLDADLKIKRRKYVRDESYRKRYKNKKSWTEQHVVDNGVLDDDYNPAQDQA